MTNLKILTVDDEPLALRRLKVLLQRIVHVDHVGQAGSYAEALIKIAALAPDIVLLDIKMRDGSGFDVVDALQRQSNPPVVIFVTAFDHFAVQAFDRSITDYLLKPVERERLVRALARAQERIQSTDAEQRADELQLVVRKLRRERHDDGGVAHDTEFWVRGSAGLVRIPVESIECVSSEAEYIAIHTTTGTHLMRSSLRQFEERVEPGVFVRIHRSWLVRKSAIAAVQNRRRGSPEIVLRDGRRLPAGRVHLRELRKAMRPQSGLSKPQAADADDADDGHLHGGVASSDWSARRRSAFISR